MLLSSLLPTPTPFEVTRGNSNDGVLRILILDSERSYDCIIRGMTSNVISNSKVITSAKNWYKSMYSLLGIPVASSPVDSFFVQADIWDWQTRKPLLPAIVYYFPPNGTLVTDGDALRTSVGNSIYWGGSERAVNGLHWMEGAIQRGNDASCEVLVEMGGILNCMVYSNWIEYMALLARKTIDYQNLMNLYHVNLNILIQFACQIVTQSGYACLSPKQPWRHPINAVEQQIQTLINAASIQFEEIEDVIKSAAILIDKLLGLNLFQNN